MGIAHVLVSSSTFSTNAVPAARQRAPTLTAMVRSQPSSRHARSWRSASLITHSVIGIISSLRSTSGMKSAGMTRRPEGWFQRISASTPSVCPVARSIFGW